ncbi:hypothetical protein ACHAXN_010256 [Cyclotella atomus]
MKSLLTTAALLLTTTITAFHHPRAFTPIIPSKNVKLPSSSSHIIETSLHSSTISPGSNVKYPTMRGSEVDSRKIISEPLLALRVGHVLFAGEELARQSLEKLTSAEMNFEQMASILSNCAETREEGGDIGWVNLSESLDDNAYNTNAAVTASTETIPNKNPNEHLDLILPRSARKELLRTPTKPGDVIMATSERGVHVIQIMDVMVDVRKLSYVKARNNVGKKKSAEPIVYSNDMEIGISKKKGGSKLLSGVLGGALIDNDSNNVDLTYKIETMGCQMNSADSERIEGQLMSLGIRPLGEEEYLADDVGSDERSSSNLKKKKREKRKPDVIVLNTCSIRDHAEQKVYSYLGPHAKRKREGEDITIIVAGCVAQQEGQSLLRRIPEIDLDTYINHGHTQVMGPQYANRISDLLEDVANGNQVVATEASHIMEDSTKPRRQSSVCAWVNVIYGCNERCTYCIVPTTRGVEQSRPVESILEEVKELVDQGYKEVTLLGQNIDAYGRDMIPKRKFSDLLRQVGAVPGLERLRFVTSHPRYMSLGVVDAVAETPTACEYFHVPFQAGSNEVLKAMGRGHTREKFLSIVERIRDRLPDAAITADVIVGFPGETEQDFLDTLSLMEEVKFDNVNTAAYSPRPNTPAATWDNQLSEEVKQDRLQRINEMNLRHATERRARMMGRTVEVLVEERNVKVPTQVMGRTRHGYIVYCDGDIDELRGKLVNVRVTQCQRYYLAGERVE